MVLSRNKVLQRVFLVGVLFSLVVTAVGTACIGLKKEAGTMVVPLAITRIVTALFTVCLTFSMIVDATLETEHGTTIPHTARYRAVFKVRSVLPTVWGAACTVLLVMATTAGSVTTVRIMSLVKVALLIGRLNAPRTSGMTIIKLKKLQMIDGTFVSSLTTGPKRLCACPPVTLVTQTVIVTLKGSESMTVLTSISNAFNNKGTNLNTGVGAEAGHYPAFLKNLFNATPLLGSIPFRNFPLSKHRPGKKVTTFGLPVISLSTPRGMHRNLLFSLLLAQQPARLEKWNTRTLRLTLSTLP